MKTIHEVSLEAMLDDPILQRRLIRLGVVGTLSAARIYIMKKILDKKNKQK